MNAVIYVRRSKESGAKQVSLETQEQHCRAYAEKIGADLLHVIRDDGVSGGDRDRFHQIHCACAECNAKVVIVYHLDRFARDTEAVLHQVRLLAKKGIDVHAVNEGRIDITSSNGLLMTTIHAALAEHYRVLVSEKTKDALAQLKAKGRRYSGKIPYGFNLIGDRLQSLEPEQAIIRAIKRLAADGRSIRGIARELEHEGHRARNGQPFAPATIHQILKASA